MNKSTTKKKMLVVHFAIFQYYYDKNYNYTNIN
jgi:hypothetical protein